MMNRNEFTANRYQNFLKKKKILDELDPERNHFILTDLDQTFPPCTKPMKEIVICDSCNEDIDSPVFVFFEEERCYHDKCAAQYPWYKVDNIRRIHSLSNVVSIFKKDKPDGNG
jgi:hypothetical protein